MMDPKSLMYFAHIVNCGSFAAASRLLNMPTTTLSRKIQELETSISGKLLQRSTRSMSLTELGAELLPAAQLLVETMSQAEQAAEDMSHEPKGRLTISCSRAFAIHRVSDWVAAFRERYPLVEVSLNISNQYTDLFASGTDFAFRVGPLADSSLIAKKVGESASLLVATPRFLQQHTISHPKQLHQLPCLQAQIDGRSYDWKLYRQNEEFSFNPYGTIRTDDLSVLAILAERHQGIAFLPEIVVSDKIQQGKLVQVLPEWKAEARDIYLVYPERNYLPNKSRVFIDFITASGSIYPQP